MTKLDNKIRKGKAEGRLLNVEECSALECGSPCPHFGVCGGCTYISLPYEEQLKIKEAQIKKLLSNCLDGKQKEYVLSLYFINETKYNNTLSKFTSKLSNGISNIVQSGVESTFKVLNLLDATKSKQNKELLYPKYDETKGIKLNLYKTFKIGQIVILKETEDEDVFELPFEKLRNRIYSVIGMANTSGSFYLKLTHMTISKPWKYVTNSHFDDISEFRYYSISQICCLTENTDFKISPTGEIIKL